MTKRQAELFPGLQSSKKYLSDYPLLVLEWHPTLVRRFGGSVIKDTSGKLLLIVGIAVKENQTALIAHQHVRQFHLLTVWLLLTQS